MSETSTGRNYQVGSNFREVLTPQESQIMERFLRDLSFSGGKAVQAGIKPNVGHFINVWSGRYKTKEERIRDQEWKEKERRAVRGAVG